MKFIAEVTGGKRKKLKMLCKLSDDELNILRASLLTIASNAKKKDVLKSIEKLLEKLFAI